MTGLRTKDLLLIQFLTLLGGTVFAWSNLIPQLSNFLATYGTFLRFSDTSIPNPLLTACLYGSSAFIVALFWALALYQNPSYRSERSLRNFLVFAIVFAASVVSYEAVLYYGIIEAGSVPVTCSPGVHPLATPCFFGALFFIAAFAIADSATRRLKQDAEN